MYTDFEIIQKSFKNEITIVPLSDLHLGAKNCMLKEIKETIKMIQETPNCYTVLVGDIIDNGVITGKGLGVYDNNLSPMQQIEQAIEILRPIKDKILACISGNHEDRSEKAVNINPMYLVCAELGILESYRNNLAILKVNLGVRKNNDGKGRRQSYTLLIHHGKGTSESAVKKDLEFIGKFEGVDGIITGHTHNPRNAKFEKIVIDNHNNAVIKREISIIVCNSFLREADYALKSMLVGASNSISKVKLLKGLKKKIEITF